MKNILIIEDDIGVQAALKWILEAQDYHVSVADNGFKGLQYLKEAFHLPFLILLDIMMPVMDGLEFRMEQQRDSKLASIPTIMMTADIHIEKKIIRNENETFINKPIKFDHLFHIIETIAL